MRGREERERGKVGKYVTCDEMKNTKVKGHGGSVWVLKRGTKALYRVIG